MYVNTRQTRWRINNRKIKILNKKYRFQAKFVFLNHLYDTSNFYELH